MPEDGLRLRVAEPDDLATVLAILTEASEWQLARGLECPWPIPFPPESVRPALEGGDLYVAEDSDGRPVGTMILQWSDAPIWGDQPPDAGYVHKLAVRRDFAGHGAGVTMLAWAEEQTRARGRRWLRLDTLTSRARLHRYYLELGFRRVGERRRGGLEITLFEKELTG